MKCTSAIVRSKNVSFCCDVVDESENDTLTSMSDGDGVLLPWDESFFDILLFCTVSLEDLLWALLSERLPLDTCTIFPSSDPSQRPSSYKRQNDDATVAMSHTSSLRVTLLKSAHNLNLIQFVAFDIVNQNSAITVLCLFQLPRVSCDY